MGHVSGHLFGSAPHIKRPSGQTKRKSFASQEVQKFTTVSELEQFMLEHGEQVIDVLGQQVDRIERNIKVN